MKNMRKNKKNRKDKSRKRGVRAPKFFKERPEGPKNVGKTAEQLRTEQAAANAKSKGIQGPAKYNVTVGGRSHSVSVEPV